MNRSAIEYGDVQGLVRFGYGSLTEACFFLLKIRDASAARAWLRTAPVSTAVELKQAPPAALQVAFTHEGLRALDVPSQVLAGFSAEFLSGMSGDESRSRRLGDVGSASPENWQWGSSGRVPHLLVMLYAQPDGLDAWRQAIQTPSWDAGFEVLDCLATSNLYGVEPFGFTDGISQPELDWNQGREVHGDQLDYANSVCLGEFLLGYRNEYGKYTDRPLLESSDTASSGLPSAEDSPEKRDLGRNGSYLVFRQLEQDVQGFWRFLNQQTNSDPAARQRLAEAMVGRRMKGEPLIPPSRNSIVGVDPADAPVNQFTYDADPDGTRCPFGAHIRRANPRNADLPSGTTGVLSRLWRTLGFGLKDFRDDVIASTRFHRLLRRGREYGSGLTPDQAIQTNQSGTGAHGIHFIALNANISRQFEFVQSSWMMGTKFGGLTEESDPLLGNRQPVPGCPVTNTFSVAEKIGPRTRITGLPTFVTVRGGAYFFLPGIRALDYIANVGASGQR
jgi:deferrochelatase/peroxidase EfeB